MNRADLLAGLAIALPWVLLGAALGAESAWVNLGPDPFFACALAAAGASMLGALILAWRGRALPQWRGGGRYAAAILAPLASGAAAYFVIVPVQESIRLREIRAAYLATNPPIVLPMDTQVARALMQAPAPTPDAIPPAGPVIVIDVETGDIDPASWLVQDLNAERGGEPWCVVLSSSRDVLHGYYRADGDHSSTDKPAVSVTRSFRRIEGVPPRVVAASTAVGDRPPSSSKGASSSPPSAWRVYAAIRGITSGG